MKKIILFPLGFIIIHSAFAQVMFQKQYNGVLGDLAKSVAQTTDGGYIISGTAAMAGGTWDSRIALVKTDSLGNIIWGKMFDEVSTNNDGNSVLQTSDGGYLVASTNWSNKAILIKTDIAGDTLWTKIIDKATANEVSLTSDGCYIIAGSSQVTSSDFDMSLIKIDSGGNVLWSQRYGSLLREDGFSCIQTSDGGFVIAGYTRGFGAGNEDVYLVKTDNVGNVMWSKTFGGAGNEGGNVVRQMPDGGFIIAGYTSNGLNNFNFRKYLVRTDVSGNLLWSKIIGLATDGGVKFMQLTADGGFIMTGLDNNRALLLKTDSSGNVQWTKGYGSSLHVQAGYYVIRTSDYGYLLTGATALDMTNGWDMFVVKTDSAGNSGCYESVADSAQMTPTTLTMNASTMSDTGATIINPPIVILSGISAIPICPVAIEETNADISSILLSPNPATSELTVDNGELKIERVEIYNVIGEKVFKSQISNLKSQISVDVRQLPAGIYFVKMRGEKEERTAKFVKQ